MLQTICDVIILIAAVLVAITNICKFFGKPLRIFQQKKEENFKENLEEYLPEFLEKHDLKIREKYLNDRKKYLEEIKNSIATEIGSDIKEIKEMNIAQNKKIKVLSDSSKDILREKIMAIYHEGKKTKTITLYHYEALEQYYKDYKTEDGNSYIDKYYNRMKTWHILEDDYDCCCE